MRKSPPSLFRSMITLGVCAFILGSHPVEFGQDKIFFHGYLIEKPVIRVGLGVNLSDIKISASSGMSVYEINSRYKLLAEDVDEIWIKGRKEKLTEKFLILVAQFRDREEAEIFAQDLRTKIEQKVTVIRDGEDGFTGLFQVRVGDFLTRGDALAYIVKLNALGIKDTWIVEEKITEEGSKPLWILVNDEMKSLHDHTVLYFIPTGPQSFLSYHGRSYRGIFVLKATARGIVLVNILNLEDYLKAVVPSELSPYNFPEPEAHKAQAVAARTYAIKNLGANEDLGFDLCDTPNSQFYKGMNAEHPLSTEAVEQTRGEVALYKNRLIEALYTSTCGGKTEDVENVFSGPALPYLQSTVCVYEKQEEALLTSTRNLPPIAVRGQNVAPLVASLISLGVIPAEQDPQSFSGEISVAEAMDWIKKARSLLGKAEDALDLDLKEANLLTLSDMIVLGLGCRKGWKT